MKHIGTRLAVLMLSASVALAAGENTRLSTAGGHISSIDPAAKSVVVKVDGPRGETQDVTFLVADDSKILKGGAAVTLSDLVKGDKVTVTYRAQEGKNVVVNIGVDSKS